MVSINKKELIDKIITDAIIFASNNKIDNIEEYSDMIKCWKKNREDTFSKKW